MYKCILFDFGRVLGYDQVEKEVEEMARLTGMEVSQLRERYFQFRGDYDQGLIDDQTYWEQITEGQSLDLNQSLIEALVLADSRSWTHMNEDMISLVGHLKDKGYITAILSNINYGVLNDIKKRFQWLERFDYAFYSCEMKLLKPHKDIYIQVLETLQLPAEACFFMDDTPANVAGAQAVGIDALVFESCEQIKAHLGI